MMSVFSKERRARRAVILLAALFAGCIVFGPVKGHAQDRQQSGSGGIAENILKNNSGRPGRMVRSDNPSEPRLEEMPDIVRDQLASGAQQFYLGFNDGYHGWLHILDGNVQTLYYDPETNVTFVGIMFTSDGRNLTLRQMTQMQVRERDKLDALRGNARERARVRLQEELARRQQTERLGEVGAGGNTDVTAGTNADTKAGRAQPAPETPQTANTPAPQPAQPQPAQAQPAQAQPGAQPDSPAEQLYAQLENSNWLAFGEDSAPVVYAFIDPKCPFCRRLMRNLRYPYLDEGQVQLRMIPIGFQRDSLAQAAMLLAADNGRQLWWRFLEGEVEALDPPQGMSTIGVERNLKVFRNWDFEITPTLFFRDASGKIKLVEGLPDDLGQMVASLSDG